MAHIVHIGHISARAAYFGSNLVGEVLMLRVITRVENTGELRAHLKMFKPISQFDGAAALIALASGLLFLAVRYPPFDLLANAETPNTRPLLIALGLYAGIVALVGSRGEPIQKAIIAYKMRDDPAAPVPVDLSALIVRFGRLIHVQVVLVTTIMVLMVIAANGGF